jgi:hypothetical protein
MPGVYRGYSKTFDLRLTKTVNLLLIIHEILLLVCRAFYVIFRISLYFVRNACLRSRDMLEVIELHALMFLVSHKFIWLSLLAVLELYALIFFVLVFVPCILLYVYERPTNALILFKLYCLSYLLLHVSASSMPSSGSLHVPTELLVPSDSLLIKFCMMDGGGF